MRFYLIIVSLLMFFSCKKNLDDPNIIIFVADDVSWDDLGCYGNLDVKTPNIDELAKNGIVFKNTFLTTSSCSPSRNSILTGRYPHNTGAAELHTEPPIEMISLPEILKNNGYYTIQAGKFHLGEYAKRGFNKIYEDRKKNGLGGEDLWVNVIENRPKNIPFFMWFASYDAHRGWGKNDFSGTHNPETIKVPKYLVDSKLTREDLSNYYDEITRFDYYIGEVVKKLKIQNIFDNTMIIIMADNGRPFPHSKTRLNDQGVKTPFIIHYPRIKSKLNYSESLISSIDIAPTITDVVKINKVESFQGKSFLDVIKNPKKKFRNYVFAEHNWHDYESHQRMVRNKNFLYIRNSRSQFMQEGPLDALNSSSYIDLKNGQKNKTLTNYQSEIFTNPRPKEELYDLAVDPYQFNNLLKNGNNGNIPDIYLKLFNILDRWIIDTGDNIPLNLTKDWYFRDRDKLNKSSSNKTSFHGIRGEMPGKSLNAVKNNNKGPF